MLQQLSVLTVTLKTEDSASHMETDLLLSTPVTSSSVFDVIDEMARYRRKTMCQSLILSLLRPYVTLFLNWMWIYLKQFTYRAKSC